MCNAALLLPGCNAAHHPQPHASLHAEGQGACACAPCFPHQDTCARAHMQTHALCDHTAHAHACTHTLSACAASAMSPSSSGSGSGSGLLRYSASSGSRVDGATPASSSSEPSCVTPARWQMEMSRPRLASSWCATRQAGGRAGGLRARPNCGSREVALRPGQLCSAGAVHRPPSGVVVAVSRCGWGGGGAGRSAAAVASHAPRGQDSSAASPQQPRSQSLSQPAARLPACSRYSSG